MLKFVIKILLTINKTSFKKEQVMFFKKINLFVAVFSLIFVLSACSTSNVAIQTLNQKANQLMKSGDIDGAIARLESINDLNPDFPQTNYNLGVAYYQKANYEKALQYLSRAIELNKTFADAYYSKAVVYEAMAYPKAQAENANDENNPANKNNDAAVQEKKLDPNTQIDYLMQAKDNYNYYLQMSKDASDSQEITTKINELNNDIIKLQSGESIDNYSQEQQ